MKSPTQDGIYAAEIYSGWKLLEWKAGAWWHLGCVGRWTATQPVQWVGPMPACIGGTGAPAKREFDL
jgi:hypothetical protein